MRLPSNYSRPLVQDQLPAGRPLLREPPPLTNRPKAPAHDPSERNPTAGHRLSEWQRSAPPDPTTRFTEPYCRPVAAALRKEPTPPTKNDGREQQPAAANKVLPVHTPAMGFTATTPALASPPQTGLGRIQDGIGWYMLPEPVWGGRSCT